MTTHEQPTGSVAPSPVVIAARDLARHYRRGAETVRALDGVDLDIRAGEAVAILGPSGSGKTTLINLISGLDAPTSGTLSLGGRPVAGLPERALVEVRRGLLGHVFQRFHLLPTLTVRENVELPLLFLRRTPERGATDRLLAAVGLADRADHLPSQLSGGQMQRTAIARALVGNPGILVADEPTGNLDRATGEAIFDLFERLVREEGLTLIVTTHNPALGRRVHRVITLEDGRIAREERGTLG